MESVMVMHLVNQLVLKQAIYSLMYLKLISSTPAFPTTRHTSEVMLTGTSLGSVRAVTTQIVKYRMSSLEGREFEPKNRLYRTQARNSIHWEHIQWTPLRYLEELP